MKPNEIYLFTGICFILLAAYIAPTFCHEPKVYTVRLEDKYWHDLKKKYMPLEMIPYDPPPPWKIRDRTLTRKYWR
jgi:hypothetical protein